SLVDAAARAGSPVALPELGCHDALVSLRKMGCDRIKEHRARRADHPPRRLAGEGPGRRPPPAWKTPAFDFPPSSNPLDCEPNTILCRMVGKQKDALVPRAVSRCLLGGDSLRQPWHPVPA